MKIANRISKNVSIELRGNIIACFIDDERIYRESFLCYQFFTWRTENRTSDWTPKRFRWTGHAFETNEKKT